MTLKGFGPAAGVTEHHHEDDGDGGSWIKPRTIQTDRRYFNESRKWAVPTNVLGTVGTNTGDPRGIDSQGPLVATVDTSLGGSDVFNTFDFSDPTAPTALGSTGVGVIPTYVQLSGRIGVLLNQNDQLQVVDLVDPTSPSVVGSVSSDPELDVSVTFGRMDIQGNTVFCPANNGNRFTSVDISDPTTPSISDTLSGQSDPGAVRVQGNHAYVYGNSPDLRVVDISDPTAMSEEATLGGLGLRTSIDLIGDFLYLGSTGSTLSIVDVSDPLNPSLTGSVDTGTGNVFEDLRAMGNMVYVVNDNGQLLSFDVRDKSNPTLVNTNGTPFSNVTCIHTDDNLIYVGDIGAGDLTVLGV